jgi:hypothetical protein
MPDREALELVQKCLDDWPYAATRVVDIMTRLEKVKELLKEQDKSRLEIAHEMVTGSILMCQGKEIVRCKDCKHRPKLLVTDIEDMESGFDLQFPDYKCHCRNDGDGWYSWYPPDDWFCADGERK